MINSFQEITTYSGFDYKDYLGQISLLHIFESIFKEYEDIELCAKIIRYIAYTHSIESNKISVGGDRRKELYRVFKEMGIPDEEPNAEYPRNYYEEIVLLKNEAIVKSIQLWLQHKDNRQLEYLFTLQNAYVQQQSAALKDIRKSTGEIDYDQKYKCIGYMMELKKMIKDAESELQQNNPKLKEAYEEIKQSAVKSNTIGVEHYAK